MKLNQKSSLISLIETKCIFQIEDQILQNQQIKDEKKEKQGNVNIQL